MTKDSLLNKVRHDAPQMTLAEKVMLVLYLSVPAMLTQLSTVAMEIIDASMVGHLGTNEAAAVGLVSTSLWMIGGITCGFTVGFYVLVAHSIGAENPKRARSIIRQGISCGGAFSLVMMVIGLAISPFLPSWLRADEAIHHDATVYFAIFSLALPIMFMSTLAAGCLRSSGNIKVPSLLNIMSCVLDVVFNYLFIFVFKMGVLGAAIGSLVAYSITTIWMMYFLIFRDKQLRFTLDKHQKFRPHWDTISSCIKIGSPISLERGVMSGAQVAISGIIAPMGSIAIAANTFGVNIESLCYMPGHGIAEASTTLVGQSVGARRQDLMRSFGWLTVLLGMVVMGLMGLIMAVFAPEMMNIVTNDKNVIDLGAEVLRIEAWAEPGFAAAIIAYHVFVGAGRTIGSSIINLVSIWGVRLTLVLLLAPSMGLHGVWLAMAIELTLRGTFFLVRLYFRLKLNSQPQ